MLSWVERRLAATLFATPPTATVEEALDHFLRVDKLTPEKPWKDNCLFIAKVRNTLNRYVGYTMRLFTLATFAHFYFQCYIQKRDYQEVAKWLKKATELPCIDHDVSISHPEKKNILFNYDIPLGQSCA